MEHDCNNVDTNDTLWAINTPVSMDSQMTIKNPDLRNDESQKNIILSARAAYARDHDNSVIISLSFVMNRSMEDNVIL